MGILFSFMTILTFSALLDGELAVIVSLNTEQYLNLK